MTNDDKNACRIASFIILMLGFLVNLKLMISFMISGVTVTLLAWNVNLMDEYYDLKNYTGIDSMEHFPWKTVCIILMFIVLTVIIHTQWMS